MRLVPVVCLLGCVLAGPARAEVLIGVAGPMSGAFAGIGAEIRAGVEAAVARVNADGGIGGEPAAVVVVDDKCDAETGAAVANQLIGRGVRAVVGHACSAAAIPAAKAYAAAGVPLASPAVTNPRFTDERIGPLVFRVAPRSDEQPQAIVRHLLSEGPDVRVAFVNDGGIFGKGLTDAAIAGFRAGGGEPVADLSFTPGEKSQNALVGQLQDAAVSKVVIGAFHPDVAVIASEMRARGLTAEIVAGDPVGLNAFPDVAGAAAEGVVVALPAEAPDAPGRQEAVTALRAAGVEPGVVGLSAYAAVEILAAIGEASDPAAAARDATHETVIGPVTFDEKGDRREPGYALFVWRGGALVPLE
ncbi:branched-chain amino acid ABC transporter substrate-binding protein [Chthonobacter rhizosphaerae]|uniref:branched-chain amino acid ABC transporter substrate-binding protein n=1 Tax=Chthonobacter rhizosphaerae TaxID=2735553 RepID=UPI0015EEFCC7|nr:branched-chain amino acid ABC transporter substrate-binding protein [Chthonobacter rhizosphaerae]